MLAIRPGNAMSNGTTNNNTESLSVKAEMASVSSVGMTRSGGGLAVDSIKCESVEC